MENGTGDFPDFIGAVLVGELDTCIHLSERKKERDRQTHENYQKKAEEETRRIAEAEAAEMSAKLASAENAILNGGRISDGQVLCALADKYGVSIPLRTRGWILNSLENCEIKDEAVSVRFRKSGKGNGSIKIFGILRELREALRNPASA